MIIVVNCLFCVYWVRLRHIVVIFCVAQKISLTVTRAAAICPTGQGIDINTMLLIYFQSSAELSLTITMGNCWQGWYENVFKAGRQLAILRQTNDYKRFGDATCQSSMCMTQHPIPSCWINHLHRAGRFSNPSSAQQLLLQIRQTLVKLRCVSRNDAGRLPWKRARWKIHKMTQPPLGTHLFWVSNCVVSSHLSVTQLLSGLSTPRKKYVLAEFSFFFLFFLKFTVVYC